MKKVYKNPQLEVTALNTFAICNTSVTINIGDQVGGGSGSSIDAGAPGRHRNTLIVK